MIMRNTLREKLDQGRSTMGTHYISSDADVPELIGDTGLYDYGEYCAEYSTFDMERLYHMARAGQCSDLPLMIKPDQEHQAFTAQAALGAGFKAVLFTDIRTVEDVWACHRAIRPDTPTVNGHMGVKLRRPALSHFDPDTYVDELSSVVFLIMIEKDIAVRNIDDILVAAKEAGVDMTQWGPADFGFSRGQPGMMNTPEITPLEERVIAKSIEHGVPPRIEINEAEEAKRFIDLGVRHFCIGWDRSIYKATLTTVGEGLRTLIEPI
jgi:4-hydroxy-2-oxoheptanedioate aldolase